MIAALVALALGADSITLFRGGPGDASLRYWDVIDTFLDKDEPNENFGRDPLLSAGPGKTVLIRFGDLRRVVGPNRQIVEAALVLNQEIGPEPKLRSIRLMKSGWIDGPDKRGLKIAPKPRKGEKSPPIAKFGPTWSPTWAQRRAGERGTKWDSQGARGEGDGAQIVGAATSLDGGTLTIGSLGQAANEMLRDPERNFGFAVEFSNVVDFSSSDAPSRFRPRLVLKTELLASPPALSPTIIAIAKEGNGFTATVRNDGVAATGAFTAVWSEDGRPLGEPVRVADLPAGQSATLKLARTSEAVNGDQRLDMLTLTLYPPPNGAWQQTALTVAAGGEGLTLQLTNALKAAAARFGYNSPESFLQEAVRLANETYLTQSRFSFAPNGSLARIRIDAMTSASGNATGVEINSIGDVAKAMVAGLCRNRLERLQVGEPNGTALEARSLYPGVTGVGDTRDESGLAKQLSMTYGLYPNPLVDSLDMEPTDLMSATEVAIADERARFGKEPNLAGMMPKQIILRMLDAMGNPMPNVTIEIVAGPQSTSGGAAKKLTAVSNGQGLAALPRRSSGQADDWLADPTSSGLKITATVFGVSVPIKVWPFLDTYARGNRTVAIVNVNAPLPAGPIDNTKNLAIGKTVVDSENDLPAQLAPLVQENSPTFAKLNLKVGGFFEIDLGRDRTIGEIQLRAKSRLWERFDILTYATAEQASQARPWFLERAASVRLELRGGPDLPLVYRGPAVRGRYIRFAIRELPKDGSPEVELGPISIYPVILGGDK